MKQGQDYQTVEAVGQWTKWLCACMTAKNITFNIHGSLQSQHTTQQALFRATNSLLKKTRRFHLS